MKITAMLAALLIVFWGNLSAQSPAVTKPKSTPVATFTPDKTKQPHCALQFEELRADGSWTTQWISSSIAGRSPTRIEYSARMDYLGGPKKTLVIIFDLKSFFKNETTSGWHVSNFFTKVTHEGFEVGTGNGEDVLLTLSTPSQKFRLRCIYSNDPISFFQRQ